MFIHNINPTLVDLGPVEIRYYGLVYVIGFLLAYWLLRQAVKHKRINLNYEDIDNLLVYIILGLLIGSRLFEAIFWQPSYYFSNPIRILEFWKGGMSFHGGLVGIIVAGWLFTRKRKIKFLELADLLSLPAMLMLAIGRIANFINGELPGRIADIRHCVVFPNYEGCRHPSQLYESLHHFIAFFIMLWMNKRTWKHGFIFWNFVLLYGVGRMLTDIWRDDPIIFLWMNMGQLLSLIMVIIAVYFLNKNHRKDLRNIL